MFQDDIRIECHPVLRHGIFFLYTSAILEIPHQVRDDIRCLAEWDDIMITISTWGHHEFILIERSRINLSQNNLLDYFARQSGMT